MGSLRRAIAGFIGVLILILYILLTGCSTSVGTKGNTALRSYPVPIEFHIAEGAYNNTQWVTIYVSGVGVEKTITPKADINLPGAKPGVISK